MTLLLVHHAAALEPYADSRRPLSAEGLAIAERLAAAVAARGFTPQLIWHSGKLRARQTAEALWLVGDHSAKMTAVRGLQPGDLPGWLHDQLMGNTRRIAVIGHMPYLSLLLALLVGSLGDDVEKFPRHGCVGLEVDGERWREVWRFSDVR
jgi:phosphohistidine phosphatase